MAHKDLDDFINQVGQINAMFLPGAMSADGAGGISSAQEMVYALRKKAAALKQKNADIKALRDDIEGLLLGMQSMNIIDGSTLLLLIDRLNKI